VAPSRDLYYLWLPRWKRALFACLGAGYHDRYVALDGAWLRARLGRLLRADVPIAEVERAKEVEDESAPSRLLFGFADQKRHRVEIRFKRKLPVRIILWELPYEGLLLSLEEPAAFASRLAKLGDRLE
jgi:hypothetical protein